MYFKPEIAKIRMSIFLGEVTDIVSPEEASLYESCLPGITVRGLEIDFLENGESRKSPCKGYLLPYSLKKENPEIKIGTTVRKIITFQNWGVTNKIPLTLEFTRLETN